MRSHPLSWLILVIFTLVMIVAGLGVGWQDGGAAYPFTTLHGEHVAMYGQGIYENETAFRAPILRGTDFVALFVGLPLLMVSYWHYRRGSWRGRLTMLGILSFFLYYGISLSLSAAYNSLFLIYVALMASAFFALVYAIAEIDLDEVTVRFMPGAPQQGPAAFMFVAGVGTMFIWLSEIVGPLLRGELPTGALGPYTTLVTHALDIGIIAPAAILTGVHLLRRAPVGYLLAIPILVLCALIGVVVISQTIFQTMAGITFSIGIYIGMIGSWLVMGTWAVWLLLTLLPFVVDTAAAAPNSSITVVSGDNVHP